MGLGEKLDRMLVRALADGADALPEDIARLTGYMGLIQELLGEKAVEREPSWALACASAAEIETLHALEAAVVERAIALAIHDLDGVLVKLEIWSALVGDDDGRRDRLVRSVEADLRRIAATRRRTEAAAVPPGPTVGPGLSL